MQRGINKATILGFVGKDPKIGQTRDQKESAYFSVATSVVFTDQNGKEQEYTEWHNIVAYGGPAKYAQKALKKGSKVYVEGRMQKTRGTGQNGVVYLTTQIVVETIQVVSNGRNNDDEKASTYAQPQQQQNSTLQQSQGMPEPVDDFDDDIPF